MNPVFALCLKDMPGQIVFKRPLLDDDVGAIFLIVQSRWHRSFPPVNGGLYCRFGVYVVNGIGIVNYYAVVDAYTFSKKVALSFNLDVIDFDRFFAMALNVGDLANTPK